MFSRSGVIMVLDCGGGTTRPSAQHMSTLRERKREAKPPKQLQTVRKATLWRMYVRAVCNLCCHYFVPAPALSLAITPHLRYAYICYITQSTPFAACTSRKVPVKLVQLRRFAALHSLPPGAGFYWSFNILHWSRYVRRPPCGCSWRFL